MIGTTFRSSAVTAAATLVVLVLATSAPAAGEMSKTVSVTGNGLNGRIDVALKDASPAEFFRSFAEILQLDLVAVPALESTLSLELHNVRGSTALTAACESVGCLWRIEDGRLELTEDPEAPKRPGAAPGSAEGLSAAKLEEVIDMKLEDADLRQVLKAFGSIAGVGVEVDDGLSGEVTIQLQDTSVRQALDALCRIHGCRWELVETPDRPVLRFSPR